MNEQILRLFADAGPNMDKLVKNYLLILWVELSICAIFIISLIIFCIIIMIRTKK